MRIITLSLIMTCVACAEAPSKPVLTPKAQTVSNSSPSAQDAASDTNSQIKASDVAEVMTSPAAAPMDMVAMEEQVQAAFASSNLTPEQNAAMSEKAVALIAAANAGDQAAVTQLSNELAQQAIGGKGVIPAFGLVDVAGIVTAIMDLIAAAADADVAGIVDALMDLAAAIVA